MPGCGFYRVGDVAEDQRVARVEANPEHAESSRRSSMQSDEIRRVARSGSESPRAPAPHRAARRPHAVLRHFGLPRRTRLSRGSDCSELGIPGMQDHDSRAQAMSRSYRHCGLLHGDSSRAVVARRYRVAGAPFAIAKTIGDRRVQGMQAGARCRSGGRRSPRWPARRGSRSACESRRFRPSRSRGQRSLPGDPGPAGRHDRDGWKSRTSSQTNSLPAAELAREARHRPRRRTNLSGGYRSSGMNSASTSRKRPNRSCCARLRCT